MAKDKRDSKDPMPTAMNTARKGGGNDPAPAGEMHKSAKAERVSESKRYSLRKGGESQPTRQNGDGNTSVRGETHNSAKAERVSEESRW